MLLNLVVLGFACLRITQDIATLCARRCSRTALLPGWCLCPLNVRIGAVEWNIANIANSAAPDPFAQAPAHHIRCVRSNGAAARRGRPAWLAGLRSCPIAVVVQWPPVLGAIRLAPEDILVVVVAYDVRIL